MLEKGELVVLKQEIVDTSIIFYPDTYVELLKVDVVPAVYAKNLSTGQKNRVIKKS